MGIIAILTNFLGISSIKSYLTVGLLLSIIIASVFGYSYVTGLKADLAITLTENSKLKTAIDVQSETIRTLQSDYEQIIEINKSLNTFVQKQRIKIQEMNKKFTINAKGESRDFGDIARAKPGLIERIVNKGTDNAFRCFEIVTGSELIKGENIDSINETCDINLDRLK